MVDDFPFIVQSFRNLLKPLANSRTWNAIDLEVQHQRLKCKNFLLTKLFIVALDSGISIGVPLLLYGSARVFALDCSDFTVSTT